MKKLKAVFRTGRGPQPDGMSAALVISAGFLLAVILMLVLYRLAVRDADADWVDLGWSGGTGLSAVLYAVLIEGWWPRKLLVASLAALWAFRLAGHIYRTRIGRGTEDGRYAALRRHWGEKANANFFWFFQAQAVLVALFSVPFLIAMSVPAAVFTLWDAAAVLVWTLSVFGEAAADRQLARFRSSPGNRGKVCREGLWKYSRHPNYFFEWLHWWTYVLLAIHAPLGWITLAGPAVMLLFLFKLTGIPYTEKQALASRGEAYRAYQAETSVFVPWFPRKGTNYEKTA